MKANNQLGYIFVCCIGLWPRSPLLAGFGMQGLLAALLSQLESMISRHNQKLFRLPSLVRISVVWLEKEWQPYLIKQSASYELSITDFGCFP